MSLFCKETNNFAVIWKEMYLKYFFLLVRSWSLLTQKDCMFYHCLSMQEEFPSLQDRGILRKFKLVNKTNSPKIFYTNYFILKKFHMYIYLVKTMFLIYNCICSKSLENQTTEKINFPTERVEIATG